MKLPRGLSGADLVKALSRVGYQVTRQTGSHVRLTHPGPPSHHVTVPEHRELSTGTLAAILGDVAQHLSIGRSELVARLFST